MNTDNHKKVITKSNSITRKMLDVVTEELLTTKIKDWHVALILSIARVTCYIIRSLGSSNGNNSDDIYDNYVKNILPAAYKISGKEADEVLAEISNELN